MAHLPFYWGKPFCFARGAGSEVLWEVHRTVVCGDASAEMKNNQALIVLAVYLSLRFIYSVFCFS